MFRFRAVSLHQLESSTDLLFAGTVRAQLDLETL
jgi:hypothetical protein